MPIAPADMAVLAVIARYYVLSREQIQMLRFPGHASGRSTRKRLAKLVRAGYLNKHTVPVAFPGATSAPVYYPTLKAADVLAAYYDDERFLATNTRTPRPGLVAHWIALNSTRIVIEAAIARQSAVTLDGWFSEWETLNKEAGKREQFFLHTQLRNHPPLSCSPDAAFLLSLCGHRKVFYVEQDLATSSPRQIAARKMPGYRELARRQGHRKHFPDTTIETFTVLIVTTTAWRRDAIAKAVSKNRGKELWLFVAQSDLTPESFLHDSIVYNCLREAGPLVKRSSDIDQNQMSCPKQPIDSVEDQ